MKKMNYLFAFLRLFFYSNTGHDVTCHAVTNALVSITATLSTTLITVVLTYFHLQLSKGDYSMQIKFDFFLCSCCRGVVKWCHAVTSLCDNYMKDQILVKNFKIISRNI